MHRMVRNASVGTVDAEKRPIITKLEHCVKAGGHFDMRERRDATVQT